MNISIIDYGMGNLLSVTRAFEHCGATTKLITSASDMDRAEKLVLPGVGAFGDGMKELRDRGLIEPIKKYARQDRSFLGICLGMQMMMDESEEFGSHQGLGLVPGKVVAIPRSHEGVPHKIPHICWNALVRPARADWDGTILSGTSPGEAVYFVHSFMAVPENEEQRLAECFYNGITIPAAIRSGNLYGCQFHPEKSGPAGLKILNSFCQAERVVFNKQK